MKFRKLRIAWSVMCGIVCVLLIVLWVRSFTVMDSLLFQYSSTSPCLRINSLHAGTFITFRNYGYGASVWRISHTPIADTFMLEDVNGQKVNTAWFHVWRNNGTSEVYAPYWFPLLLSGAHTAAQWIGRSNRFSLRTLLIVTTLVAVVLGLVVWLSRTAGFFMRR